jgi:hypothetical protein
VSDGLTRSGHFHRDEATTLAAASNSAGSRDAALGCFEENPTYLQRKENVAWTSTKIRRSTIRIADGGQLEDADEDAMMKWAIAYEERNGAPENEEDC